MKKDPKIAFSVEVLDSKGWKKVELTPSMMVAHARQNGGSALMRCGAVEFEVIIKNDIICPHCGT
jgi:hypothetical protein